jgi:alkylresorcinol/alkylpyrone synthase
MAQIAAVSTGVPEHRYDQERITQTLISRLGASEGIGGVIAKIHRATAVKSRSLAMPLESYLELNSFSDANAKFASLALPLLTECAARALAAADIDASEVDTLFFTTVTGVAAPSLDVALIRELGLRTDVKRTPSFGLGCVAGASGLARAADFLAGHPQGVALVVAVELCSLTIQWDDPAMSNIVGTGLFGDGAAAAVLLGDDHPKATGPKILATQSSLYPASEEMIGWRIGSSGFQLMLEAGVPALVAGHFRADIERLLKTIERSIGDVGAWFAHPGGPKILEAFAAALELDRVSFAASWQVMSEVGNLSSAAVLHVLARDFAQPQGTLGLLFALGPGVSVEIIAMEW